MLLGLPGVLQVASWWGFTPQDFKMIINILLVTPHELSIERMTTSGWNGVAVLKPILWMRENVKALQVAD